MVFNISIFQYSISILFLVLAFSNPFDLMEPRVFGALVESETGCSNRQH